jgi:hypothetical protein
MASSWERPVDCNEAAGFQTTVAVAAVIHATVLRQSVGLVYLLNAQQSGLCRLPGMTRASLRSIETFMPASRDGDQPARTGRVANHPRERGCRF